jgi:tetratricopeptide (TPR) repeat protein
MEVLSPRPTGERQKTLFVTFYSFKGGVGRTLALLNVACILAGLGRRVLMIDFDLEAPGLTHFQDKQIEAGVSRQQPGLVDAIDAFLDDPRSSPLGEQEPSIFFDRYVSSLKVPDGVQKGEKEGTLDLVPSGRLDADYEGRMYDLNFEEMFEEGVGRPLFERLKDLIEDSGRYDYILVDSRTGFSDEGSICTRFLGDYLMVLTGLNHQNVQGTARFLRQSNVAERDETLALVASPVPMYYEDLRARRMKKAKEHIADRADLDEVRFVTQIPYHPVLALEEDPTVRSLDGTDLFESYEDITERLRTWAGDLPKEQIERIPNLIRNGDTDEALAVFRKVTREDSEVGVQFLRRMSGILTEEYSESVVELLKEGIETAERLGDLSAEGVFLSSLSRAYIEQGEIEEAIATREEAVNVSRTLDDVSREAIDLHSLGSYYASKGDLEKGIDYQECALDLFRELHDQRREAIALGSIGYSYLDRGNAADAIQFFEQARNLALEIDEKSLLLYALGNLGICHAIDGNEEKTSKTIERAAKITRDLDEDEYQAVFHFDRARALSHLNPRQALESLFDSWTLIQEHPNVFDRMRAHVLRARLQLEVENDAEGAAEDVQKALDFYREGNVDSRWSREAEEILEKAQTHIE